MVVEAVDMDEGRKAVERLYEEFVKFERAMEELHFLKMVAQDLKSFRKMLKFRRYD
ncbi:MAG: hypothetical protein QXG76_03910 [Candidatus Bathyarchaeia archaeon]